MRWFDRRRTHPFPSRNVAIAALTHAHVRKYSQTLYDNAKLNWVAVSCSDQEIVNHFNILGFNVPVYDSTEDMLIKYPEMEGRSDSRREQSTFR